MFIFRSIVGKLWLALIIFTVFALVTTGWVMSGQFESLLYQRQWDEMKKHGQELVKILAESHDQELIQREINFWGQISGFKIAVIDTQGTVVYSSDLQHAPPGSSMTSPEMYRSLVGEEITVKQYHHQFEQDMLSVMLPMGKGDRITGILVLHSPLTLIQDFLKSIYRSIFIVIIATMLLSSILGLLLARVLAVPLLKMTRVAKQMANGDFKSKVDAYSSDEIGLLGKNLNLLSTRLDATLKDLAHKNKELERVLDLQKEFMASVSHELRTPLFLIQGYSEAMLDGTAAKSGIKEKSLHIILDEALRLRRLVEDLLDLRKTEKENLVETRQEIQPEPVLERVYNKFQQAAAQKRVALILDEKSPLPTVLGVEDRLEQVLTNLVDNALRYSPPGSHITIKAENTLEDLQLSVSDQGPGIPGEVLPFIWEHFYKVDRARTRQGSGTGLGLVISRNIVRAHGGRIWVESKEGEGATFKFVIPVVK